jgi:hypothetical protein
MGVRFSLIAFLAWLSLLLLLAVIGIVPPVSAASPPSSTIAPGDPPVTWFGGPFTGTTSDPVSANCGNSECDDGGGALAAALPHGETHAAKAGTGPFDPSGKIAYSVASAGRVLIRVFSANGRLVRTLFDQVVGPGRHITRWNGRSEDGAKLPSGVYLFRVQHPDGDLSTVKTVLLR